MRQNASHVIWGNVAHETLQCLNVSHDETDETDETVGVLQVSQSVVLPAQDTYSVVDLVKATGYSRSTVNRAIANACPNAEMTSRGYRLNVMEMQAVVSVITGKGVEFAPQEEPETVTKVNAPSELPQLLELLSNQIAQKDRQIESLTQEMRDKSNQIESLLERLAEAQELLKTSQDSTKALSLTTALQANQEPKKGLFKRLLG